MCARCQIAGQSKPGCESSVRMEMSLAEVQSVVGEQITLSSKSPRYQSLRLMVAMLRGQFWS